MLQFAGVVRTKKLLRPPEARREPWNRAHELLGNMVWGLLILASASRDLDFTSKVTQTQGCYNPSQGPSEAP